MNRSSAWVADAASGRLVGDDVEISGTVTTDSREVGPGGLYVARRGENSDGHDYVAGAIEKGAVAVIVEHTVDAADAAGIAQVVVEDSTEALGEVARAHLADLRERGPLRVLAVTGSAGKTTTKDLLAQLFAAQAPTVAPKLSFNNEVGLPLTVLRADESTRYLVLEMGASGPGHIDYLTRIAPPDVAIELMVGTAHLGGFGSREGVARAKAELVEGLVDGGTAVLNWDDEHVREMAGLADHVRFFAVDPGPDVSVWSENLRADDEDRVAFDLCTSGPDGSAERAAVQLRLVGLHHVHNALAAATAALVEGIPLATVAGGLSEAGALSPHRMAVSQIQVPSGGAATLIDDSYNANNDSMGAAIRALHDIAGERRTVAVLGEMLELGDESDEIHRAVGQAARDQGTGVVIALGSDATGYLVASDGLVPTYHVEKPEDAIALLGDQLRDDDVVLIKGSNGSGAWKVADALNRDEWSTQE